MKLHPRVTRAGLALVKRLEGYRRKAVRGAGGGYVVGYGHTLTARAGAEVGEADAEALLWFDLSRIAGDVEAAVLAPLSDPQFEALVAFAFNIGLDNFATSTVVARLNEGAYLQAAAAIELWRRADFDGDALVVDALVRRRAAEKAHFLASPEGFAPAPTGVIRPAFDHAVSTAALAWGERAERTVHAVETPDGDVAANDAPTSRLGDWAPSAAIAAADAISARLSRILPDASREARSAPPPIAKAPSPIAKAPPPAAPAPSPFDPPPPPPPVRAFAFEGAASRGVDKPLFGAPQSVSPGPAPDAAPDVAEALADAPPRSILRPLLENAAVFASLGAVGLALFVLAVVCMLQRPSLLCLLAGLVGVVAMAPAAAFFLFRFIGAPLELEPPRAGVDASQAERPGTPRSTG